MPDESIPVSTLNASIAHINKTKYQKLYQQSVEDPETFWSEQAKQFIHWIKPWNSVLTGSFAENNVIWFQGGVLNASYNCLDRHLSTHKKRTAIIWESDNPNISQTITYQDLFSRVCAFANVLKILGIKKGDSICIYLPMIPEVVVAMLACARIGAIHSVVFAGFSAEALKTRILDAHCKLVITANEGLRGNKTIPLKNNVDQALRDCPKVKNVLVIKRTDNKINMQEKRDVWYHQFLDKITDQCPFEPMDANDPLFILYTSGSTGKPKGIQHGTGGYLVYAAITFKYIFDYHKNEVYWCTADVGWVTGHTYSVYGPLLNGATLLLFEGIPTYPTPSRYWDIVDKHHVNIFYSAPTAIRALRREGDEWVKRTSRQSLRVLGSVGEPINPEAWKWYYQVVGNNRCPIVDTWWQTETGGIMLSPFIGATPLKPGSAAWPFFGVVPMIVDDQGNEVPAGQMGKLVIVKPWPGMMQTIYGDHQRFVANYFQEFPGKYVTSDQAHRDEEGYFWIEGRSDDVLKISGHRIGTQEVESAMICHPNVAETAVVGIEDDIKGHAIFAFILLKPGITPGDKLKQEIQNTVREKIGAIAVPAYIQWVDNLPKTRSGKIMRRLLLKIAKHDTQDLGDLSTLAEPEVIQQIIKKMEGEPTLKK